MHQNFISFRPAVILEISAHSFDCVTSDKASSVMKPSRRLQCPRVDSGRTFREDKLPISPMF